MIEAPELTTLMAMLAHQVMKLMGRRDQQHNLCPGVNRVHLWGHDEREGGEGGFPSNRPKKIKPSNDSGPSSESNAPNHGKDGSHKRGEHSILVIVTKNSPSVEPPNGGTGINSSKQNTNVDTNVPPTPQLGKIPKLFSHVNTNKDKGEGKGEGG